MSRTGGTGVETLVDWMDVGAVLAEVEVSVVEVEMVSEVNELRQDP